MKVLAGGERRAHRRSLRTLLELPASDRTRLRELLTRACLVVMPTSSAVGLVTARLAPGSVTVGVAATEALGLDQTIAVAEILATRGFDVRPHLAANQMRETRRPSGVLDRLAARRISEVLLVPDRSVPDQSIGDLVREVTGHAGMERVGVEAVPIGGPHHRPEAEAAVELARAADFVSTRPLTNSRELLAWVAEMRVRGLETPVELGFPGVVRMDALRRSDPKTAAQVDEDGRRQWYNPTDLIVSLARDAALDRLHIGGIRIETLNFLDETAAWRQQLFDLAAPRRTVVT